ncbi:MAG: hypothetical protein QGG42_18935 [Phycisphaerae bacterium]|jgi:hypothetical protein|nr:hypothetical protein [Phycisphaerae bacterium]
MPKQNMRDIVGEKIEAETRQAGEIADGLAASNTTLTDQSIRAFFPHHEQRWGRSRSNLPAGIPFATQIVYGHPTTFDLYPESRLDFEQRYGISMHAAISLAERGRILPNLYVRNEKEWEGYNDMRKLVSFSTANGVRVDAYLGARFPKHAESMRHRREIGHRLLDNLNKSDPQSHNHVLDCLHASEESAARVLGARWAYLDSFAPDGSDVFHELLDRSEWDLAFDYLTTVQNLTVSPISGALGGYFVWSNVHIETLRRLLAGELRSSIAPRMDAKVASYASPEVMSFLAKRLGGVGALEFLNSSSASALVTITDDQDFTQLRTELHEAADQLSIITEGGETPQAAVKRWESAAKGMKTKLKYYERGGDIVLPGILGVLGCFLGGWIGAGAGGVLGGWLSQESKFGRHLHALMRPEEHRFMTTLDKIEELRDR